MPTRRLLILSASMGAGHDGVAGELARRLATGGVDAEVIDVLDLLPLRLGGALRWWYGWMMRTAPWLYAVIYRVFFVSDRAPSTSPLTALAAARLERLVRRRPPAAVVSTFHLAAQVTGHLRERGRLSVTSTVLLTDFAVHRLWLHPGNDGYLCPTAAAALGVTAATGRPASCHAPVVREEFRRPGADPAQVRSRIGARPDDRLVLISTGAWGVGRAERTARVLVRSGRYVPVVLCGNNGRLLRRLRGAGGGVVALGWRDDLPELMAAAHAVVDNAAGLTCTEALAAGVPVISYLPIPGHGRAGARAMARAGLSVHASDAASLLGALDRLADSSERDRQIARGTALFSSPPAEALLAHPTV
ncbi:MGDG synthase family glycosyltransferase [Actinomadura alba]|uniref:Glycosyltransferase n=1 Tax=Actinomadura alba TaxID=406431 RepID=A0ABR7LZH5_9ACTN|nr:glycosyltransferase [Actinomadura alba]MBC6470181.1 glycosyltransferase [Actinomadura alba]